jgi:hypothetical protein
VSPDRRPTAAELMTGKAQPRVQATTKPDGGSKSAPPPPAPSAPPPAAGKTTRITLDLDPAAYKELNRWLGTAAAEVGQPVSKARALRAMIRAVSLDKSIGLVVTDLLRREQS